MNELTQTLKVKIKSARLKLSASACAQAVDCLVVHGLANEPQYFGTATKLATALSKLMREVNVTDEYSQVDMETLREIYQQTHVAINLLAALGKKEVATRLAMLMSMLVHPEEMPLWLVNTITGVYQLWIDLVP